MSVRRWRGPLAGAAASLLLAGCQVVAPGGGVRLTAAQAAAVAAREPVAPPPAPLPPALQTPSTVKAPAGMPTATSLRGWEAGGAPAIDPGVGDPRPPSLRLAGNGSYVWRDLGKPLTAASFDLRTEGLADFYFGCNDSGAGWMFRIDTRGGSNFTGFAQTASWTQWNAPVAGTLDAPANTWIHVALAIGATDVSAVLSWPGHTEHFRLGVQSGIAKYQPAGTAFGFQGDRLAASSMSWIANFT